jgi:glucose/arabinose dehydrogenase
MLPAPHRWSRTQGRARVETRLVCAIAILGSPATVPAVTLPDHFAAEVIPPGTHFNQPTTFAFLPDGRILVAEKRGVVRMVEHGVKLVPPVWDGSTEVLTQGDRGLIGLAVDPDFLARPYLYLLYAVDPDSNGTDLDDDTYGRLSVALCRRRVGRPV